MEYEGHHNLDSRSYRHKTERLKLLNEKGIELAVAVGKQEYHGKRASLGGEQPKAAIGFKKRVLNNKSVLNIDNL